MLFYYRLTGFMYNNLLSLYKNVRLVNLMATTFCSQGYIYIYHNDPKFSDRYAWANSAHPEEQSDQGLHCLPFSLHH